MKTVGCGAWPFKVSVTDQYVMGDETDEQLEQRVDQLEDTVRQMLPNRRGVIKGLGAAGSAASGAPC
ncbi:MAG: hypothetical protein HQRvContig02_1, partial [Haloquadratum phage sp.]